MSPQLKIIKGYLRTYHYLKYAANFRLGGRVLYLKIHLDGLLVNSLIY